MKIARVRLFSLAVSAVAAVFATSVALAARFAMSSDMPVDRLITNCQAWIDEHPDDATGYGALARIHSYALKYNATSLGVYQWGDQPPRADDRMGSILRSMRSRNGGEEPVPPGMPERVTHATEAIRNYAYAMVLDPDSAKNPLGLAYTAELAAPMAGSLAFVPDQRETPLAAADPLPGLVESVLAGDATAEPKVLERLYDAAPLLLKARAGADDGAKATIDRLLEIVWWRASIRYYLLAFDLAFPEDSKREELPLMGGLNDLMSYEAASSALRLVQDRPYAEDPAIKPRLAKATEGMAELAMIPPNLVITPIIFSIERPARLDDLLSGDTAKFDLDGDSLVESWPWVNPDTAILVWDPDRTGTITSGRQLFGSVTWWLLLEDGYRALDLLDDDRDGWLRGNELPGIALWFDRNRNGVSEPGEVIPIEDTPVAALSTHWNSRLGESFANDAGLELKDGRLLPTYDWVTHPTPVIEEDPARTLAGAASP